jgi:hypothetical protein
LAAAARRIIDDVMEGRSPQPEALVTVLPRLRRQIGRAFPDLNPDDEDVPDGVELR